MQTTGPNQFVLVERRRYPRVQYQKARLSDKLQRRLDIKKILVPVYYVISTLLVIYLAFIQPQMLRAERDKVELELRKELADTKAKLIEATPLRQSNP